MIVIFLIRYRSVCLHVYLYSLSTILAAIHCLNTCLLRVLYTKYSSVHVAPVLVICLHVIFDATSIINVQQGGGGLVMKLVYVYTVNATLGRVVIHV